MSQQKAVLFYHGVMMNQPAIDEQINTYLAENQNCKVTAASYAVGSTFEKALVIFDVNPGPKQNVESKERKS